MSSYLPKLEVFKITLKPHKNIGETFKDFCIAKLIPEKKEQKSNEELFVELFRYFVKEIDKDSYYTKNKKGFTAYDTDNPEKSKFRFNSSAFHLSGFIEGGVYGLKRSTSNISNKKQKSDIPEDNVVSDRFFFLIHIPLESQYGIMMISSYSISTITSLFIAFIEDLFCLDGHYYKPEITRYIPDSFKEKYKKESVLKTIKFETITPSKKLGNTSYEIEDDELIVKVEVSSKKIISSKNASNFYNSIKNIKIGEIKLQDFFRKKVDVADMRGQSSSFDIDKEFDPSPKIYLEGKVTFNIDGTPEEDSLFKYSLSLLEEVKKKVYPLNHVKEH